MRWFGHVALLITKSPTSLILQFDGSLRHPSDPGISTSSLGRIAACAACIVVDDKLIRIGGRLLPSNSQTTSGEVEYEGLLFGLDGLRSYLEDIDAGSTALESHVIIVQGDCKNVIEQMKGSAKPRKLEGYHSKATKFLRDMLPSFCRLEFVHIPRVENILCDRASAYILKEHQQTVYRSFWNELRDLRTTMSNSHMLIGPAESGQSPGPAESGQSPIGRIVDRYLTKGTSLVPLTQRPIIYNYLARLAELKNDFPALLMLGKLYLQDVETCQSGVAGESSILRLGNNTVTLDMELLGVHCVEAVTYQIVALEALRRSKDVVILRRKYRRILERYALCSNGYPAGFANFGHWAEPIMKHNEGVPEWPLAVLQWQKEAFASPIWQETHSFWCSVNESS